MTKVKVVHSDDLDGLAEPAEFVVAVRDAYRQVGEGAPAEPRTKLVNDDPGGMLTTYAAILPETGMMGGYMYSAGFGTEDAWFTTPLFDAESGELQAILDGASMNPFKTGATGAVAVDELARDGATSLGIIGTGPQARGQLATTETVRDFEKVRVFSPTEENRTEFAAEYDDRLDADVYPVNSAAEAVDGVDVVITATTSPEPVFDGDLLSEGTHVTAMGQYDPAKRELDETTIARAKYVPDLRARATHDAGSFIAALEAGVVDENHIHAELGEVVSGVKPGRESQDEITVFDSGGTGIETVGAAAMLYEKAVEEGLGTNIDIAPASEGLTGK